MSILRDAAARVVAMGKHPTPPMDRLLDVEHAVRRLASRGQDAGREAARAEVWTDFLSRLNLEDLPSTPPRDFRRLLDEIWLDSALDNQAEFVLEHGVNDNRKSYDRSIILAYLRHFPEAHPIFEKLATASRVVSERHDWPWLHRGKKWKLWDPELGPTSVCGKLLTGDAPMDVLTDAGLDHDLAEGAFVKTVLLNACAAAASKTGADGEVVGRRLIRLFDGLGTRGLDPFLAFALLRPWTNKNPSDGHQASLTKLLVTRIGDPRLQSAKWAAAKAEVQKWMPEANFDDALTVLRRWLVQATVREFFSVVGKTTNDPVQWRAREAFWLAYLDAGLISDAWFAFGRNAEARVKSMKQRDDTIRASKIVGGDHDPSHSSLLMTIGDLRIAEWSHSGACRFWHVADPKAPLLYRPTYQGSHLRAMYGGKGFERLSHTKDSFQPRFARHIYTATGVMHPKHGKGW